MFKFSAQNYGPDFVLLNYNHQMGPFGPSPMLGLGETFDLLKILFLCSKVHFLNLIYTEVYVTMDSKTFPSFPKWVN